MGGRVEFTQINGEDGSELKVRSSKSIKDFLPQWGIFSKGDEPGMDPWSHAISLMNSACPPLPSGGKGRTVVLPFSLEVIGRELGSSTIVTMQEGMVRIVIYIGCWKIFLTPDRLIRTVEPKSSWVESTKLAHIFFLSYSPCKLSSVPQDSNP